MQKFKKNKRKPNCYQERQFLKKLVRYPISLDDFSVRLNNYLEYNETGDTRLHLIDFPLFEEIINNNRLLHMKNGTIHFKFEEALNNEKTNGY